MKKYYFKQIWKSNNTSEIVSVSDPSSAGYENCKDGLQSQNEGLAIIENLHVHKLATDLSENDANIMINKLKDDLVNKGYKVGQKKDGSLIYFGDKDIDTLIAYDVEERVLNEYY